MEDNNINNTIVGYVVTGILDECFFLALNSWGNYYFHDGLNEDVAIFKNEEEALDGIEEMYIDSQSKYNKYDIYIHPLYGYITEEKKKLELEWK
jgi:hypothetical protein